MTVALKDRTLKGALSPLSISNTRVSPRGASARANTKRSVPPARRHWVWARVIAQG